MTARNALRLCAFLLAAGVAACSNASKSSPASAEPTSDTSSAAKAQPGSDSSPNVSYPEWASAVVPDYGSVLFQVPITQREYAIQTVDDAKDVLAWYKARVPGNWSYQNAGYADWTLVVRGVQISINQKTDENKTSAFSNNVNTMIYLTLR